MMQRYRTIAHLVDPIIEAGHELTVVVSHDEVNIEKYRRFPTDAADSAPNTVRFIARNFGIKMRHFNKVKWTTKKKPKADIHLCYDDHDSKCLGIPYVRQYCYWRDKRTVVGNPMCEALRNHPAEEEPGSLLLIHPGGGRGYISPQRQDTSKEKVTASNIKFLQQVIDNLPESVHTVRIKPHPLPYRRCTVNALTKFVIPELKHNLKIEVVDTNLIEWLKQSEYVLNFGGTTALWLIGSGKKWFNILGMDWYRASRERLIPQRGGGIRLEELKTAQKQAEDSTLFNMPATENIMRQIHESLGV